LGNEDAICALIETFNDLDAAIADGRVFVEREACASPESSSQKEESSQDEMDEVDEMGEIVGGDDSEDFIYRYLASRLKPYVDGLTKEPKTKGVKDAALHQRQKAFYKELTQRHSQSAKRKETEDAKKKAAITGRTVQHKKKVSEIKRNRFVEELEREATSRALRKGSRDEQLFKQLFQTAVKVEKETLREEQRKKKGEIRKQEVEKKRRQTAIQKYYQDQAQLLEEQIATERYERQQAEHAHRLEMDRMEREMELKLMERLRTQHEEKWQRKEADEIKRFDAERISSKLLQTLSKTARPKSARARLRGS